MKKIFRLKFFSFLVVLFCLVNSGFGQIKLAELTFETPGGYSTSIVEFTDYIPGPGTPSDGRDYFLRTDGSNTRAEIYTNKQGSYYFAAQDIEGEGATLPVYLSIENINISGYSNLEFRVHLAEDDATDGNENWDNSMVNNDYVHINYDIDNSGTFNNLLWIESSSSGLSNAPAIDTNFDGTGNGTVITNAFTQFIQNMSGTGDLLDIQIVFSLDAEEEDIAIDNIEIWGTLVPCGALVTWDGGAATWSNGSGPTISNEVELNGDYNTFTYGSFSACSLNVNSGTLTINDNTYVEVQNNLTVDGNIIVTPYGSIIQKNDHSTIGGAVLTTTNKIIVEKETAPAYKWYEYTYWSSPVLGETINSGLNESQADRRFKFNGQNYLDATAETNNNNTTIAGQDNIDDNNNDWQWVNGTTTMLPGVGYASTHDEASFFLPPGPSSTFQNKYTFEGPFNNGIVKVPIYRNDSETADFNWNLIGNPYPSAIDADLFLAANSNIAIDIDGSDNNGNSYIDGAIFLWSQNTAPSSTANGNQQSNFSNDDYAIINATGESAGGDGVTPSRHIPSGQGFFISMSNTAPASIFSGDVYTTDVTFSNSMRIADLTSNSQFFKNSSTKTGKIAEANKLWLNLTSDNGVFNQILVGYVNGATNSDDGIAYDTAKYPTKGSALYTTIQGSNKKFAIQGKDVNSLDANEIVMLGFKTTINVATLYKLSIAKFQGDFLTNNTIYLKDNLLNKTYNLSASDYTFTSEVGEFNDRFAVVFNANTLSTDKIIADENNLYIVELDDDKVQFSISNNLKITSVSIFDLLGRQLYCFKGQNRTETFTFSNLSSTVYIAKVSLSNGAIISKKAIKK